MKNIVVIGGGSGIFNVLKGLKNYPVSITSVVTMFDNGGSTGLLRDEFGILPPGDIRRSLVALAPDTENSTLRDLFNFRFEEESSLRGHSFGNLFLQALTSISGSEVSAIKKASVLLNIKHVILPISIDDSHLCATLENGLIIKGETNIDIPKHDGSLKIHRLYLEPNATIYCEAYDAILFADLVVIGPGDLYTSILPHTLVQGFTNALKETNAKVAYIMNTMTKWGETNDFTATDFITTLLSYLKKDKVDYVICNSTPLKDHLLKKYAQERSVPVQVNIQELQNYANKVIADDVITQTDVVRHDAKKKYHASSWVCYE